MIAYLTKEQQILIQAETAVLECRFEEAYPLLESIKNTEDIYTEIGCLWNAGICCIGLNKPDVFSRIFLKLQMILSRNIPHQKDLMIVLDALKTYIETIDSSAHNNHYNVDLHEQCLPAMCAQMGYSLLAKEMEEPNSTNTALLELCLRFLNTTSAVVTIEMMLAICSAFTIYARISLLPKSMQNLPLKLPMKTNFIFLLLPFTSILHQ